VSHGPGVLDGCCLESHTAAFAPRPFASSQGGESTVPGDISESSAHRHVAQSIRKTTKTCASDVS
jgi:hypothetical protein